MGAKMDISEGALESSEIEANQEDQDNSMEKIVYKQHLGW